MRLESRLKQLPVDPELDDSVAHDSVEPELGSEDAGGGGALEAPGLGEFAFCSYSTRFRFLSSSYEKPGWSAVCLSERWYKEVSPKDRQRKKKNRFISRIK